MTITLKQISDALNTHGIEMTESYQSDTHHMLSGWTEHVEETLATVAIMGINFEKVDHFAEAVIYRCMFSNEVLANSVKVTFECTK